MDAMIVGCSARAANASASRREVAAWLTDSLTWLERAISDFRGVRTIGLITNMTLGLFDIYYFYRIPAFVETVKTGETGSGC